MPNLCLLMHARDTIFIDWVHITLPKLREKCQSDPLRNFLLVEKMKKKHTKLCIIMLINPPYCSFLENIIFYLQITIDKEHPVEISSRSDHRITTDIM